MIEYVGERIWAGALGNTFVIIAFTAGLLACSAYFFGVVRGDTQGSWKKLARTSFYIHAAAVLGIVVTLITMLAGHMYEYHYIWQHSNSEMPMRFIFSAFWEGQEGSTILWLFWHAVVGTILLHTSKKWEYRVMSVFMSAQVLLSTMVLGVFVFGKMIGSNPFTILLRQHPEFTNVPFLQNPNYLQMLDGTGLNPLLQNYWMTIHPPTLFLGFALTLVPFAFAVAALWKGDFKSWVKPALPWSFTGVGVLGLGILMGGAWAYESLSFGGFWAWDPVENASLVPWLTLVGGAHLLLIQRSKGASLVWTFALLILTFILILYSTFLTKSGVLGETSVHSFTDMGLSGQLLVYLGFFVLLGFGMLAYRYKQIPKKKKEDPLWSREFWMFVGALVLLLSGFQIFFSTSIPVWNKLFGTDMAPPGDPNAHYNAFQIPFAVVVALIIGLTQYLRYKKTPVNVFMSKILRDALIAAVVTLIGAVTLEMKEPLLLTLLFASVFAVAANTDYLIRGIKAKNGAIGSAMAHLGFALLLVGALVSQGKQEVISNNTTRYDLTTLDSNYSNDENILLMLDDTVEMAKYNVAYRGKKKEGIHVYYDVEYIDPGTKEKLFTLQPFVQLNERMGNVAEPSTKNYWNHDVFTYVKYAELEERQAENKDKWHDPEEHTVKAGDTIYGSTAIFVFTGLNPVKSAAVKDSFGLSETDLLVRANLLAFDFDTKSHLLQPYFGAKNAQIVTFPSVSDEIFVKVDFVKIDPETEEMTFAISEKKNRIKEFIIMKAVVFPYINILWIGCVLMVIGTVTAVVTRIKRNSA